MVAIRIEEPEKIEAALMVDIDLERVVAWVNDNVPENPGVAHLAKVADTTGKTVYEWDAAGMFRGSKRGRHERRQYDRADAVVCGILGALSRRRMPREILAQVAASTYASLDEITPEDVADET